MKILLIMLFSSELFADSFVLQDWVNPKIYIESLDIKDISFQKNPKHTFTFVSVKSNGHSALWFDTKSQLSVEKGVKFFAKANESGILRIHLKDANNSYVESQVKLNGSWQEYIIPKSKFKTGEDGQENSVEHRESMNWSKVSGVSFYWTCSRRSSFQIGPIEASEKSVPAFTGFENYTRDGFLVVQDYSHGEGQVNEAYKDELGSSIELSIAQDELAQRGSVTVINYDLSDDNRAWVIMGVTCGDVDLGQNWNGHKHLYIRVCSDQEIELEMSFEDVNRNNYVSPWKMTSGDGWELLKVDLKEFMLNDLYQPKDADPTKTIDLTKIERLMLRPMTPGAHKFKIDYCAIH